MATEITSARLEQLRRDAQRLKRQHSLTTTEAQNRVAQGEGFPTWALLSRSVTSEPSAAPPRQATAAPDHRARHYLHGDQTEDDASKYYCARCDYFVEAEHFEGGAAWHGSTSEDGERFLSSLNSWKRAAQHSSYHRPEDPPNILAAKAVREVKDYEASRAPFHRWLLTQSEHSGVIGDLARDVRRDKSFPVRATSKEELEEHLGRYGRHIVEALNEAWDEFEQRGPA